MTLHILEIQTGKHKGRKIKLTSPETIIGRDEASKIRIASKEVSRHHCSLILEGDAVIVRDQGSSNGTFIDGRPVQGEAQLSPGSSITIGPMTFRLLGDSPPKAARKATSMPQVDASQRLSDDDIASWLVEDIQEESATSDTTIINATDPPAPPEPKTSAPRREFQSVAEEAADIIRRHYEMTGQKPPGNA